MQKVGKEVKIGLAVIGVLLVAFGYVLVKKLTQGGDSTTDAGAPTTAAATTKEGTPRPTVVTASDSERGGDDAADSKRSPWSTASDRTARSLDFKQSDPAADSRSPFAPTARESAAVPEPRGASRVAGDDNTTAATDANDSHRRDAHSDDHRFGGAVQTSDTAPLANGAADGAAAPDSRSFFGKGAASKLAADKDSAGDGSAAGKSPADPFQSRFGNAAAPSNAFERRSTEAAQSAAANGTADPSSRKATDSSFENRDATAKSFADRAPTRPNSISGADDSGFKVTAPDNPRADSANPLRRSEAQPAAEAGDATSRWSGSSRVTAADSSSVPNTIPTRAGSAFDNGASPAAARFSAGAGAAQPLAPDESAAKPGQYVVQPNDNYWTISEKVYGSGGYFKAIFEHNRRQHPNAERLQVGESLSTPDVATLQREYPDLCPKPGHAAAPQRIIPASARMRPGTKVYVVEEGDTLFEIARHQLGKPSRWGEIYQLNREVLGSDFDYLKPGTELLLPVTDSRPDPIARQPNGTAEK
jgi:nucleoid-associated protein YgaU